MDIEEYIKQPLPFEKEVEEYFHSGDKLIIFEIGACEGEDTIRLQRKFPDATIHAFEPLPKNIGRMKKHYKKYGASDINIHQLALSDKDGTAEFYVSSGHPDSMPKTAGWDYGNKSSSLLKPTEHKNIHKWLKFKKKIDVKTQRLDTFCKEHHIANIDFAYIDVQGAELMVLEGAGELIKNVGMIWMEVEAVELYASQPLKDEVEEFMKSIGFKCIKDAVEGIAGDQLYINERLERHSSNRQKRPGWILGLAGVKKETVDIGRGLRMTVPKDMRWSFDESGYYEKNVTYWLEKIAQVLDMPVFYDVGANYGYYTVKLSSSCTKVYAFEPVASTFSVLKKNVEKNKLQNIVLCQAAIGKKAGIADINVYSSSGNNSIFDRKIPKDHPLKFIKKEKIKIESLSNLIQHHGFTAPTLIKIDVEGGELDVLKGSLEVLDSHKTVLFVEYSITTSQDAGYDRQFILEKLLNAKYRVYGLSSSVDDLTLYSPQTSKVDIDNLIAVPGNMKLDT